MTYRTGPSGVGKSTTVQALHDRLTAQGRPARRTVGPTRSALGQFTCSHANQIYGLALACLVAANRYEHIETGIGPAVRAGELIIRDRYRRSSLVARRVTARGRPVGVPPCGQRPGCAPGLGRDSRRRSWPRR
ncbi:hypothetical protein [Streptomyces sp. GESEQ-4]|uniref:dTMP kinase n=1 Tax=Streptomyces sp. GESEQ-4 TaxID=2812655 RepID=UPI001FF0C95B|nr:hypothetical protein [Streptomyces sp. GESEQ-4]